MYYVPNTPNYRTGCILLTECIYRHVYLIINCINDNYFCASYVSYLLENLCRNFGELKLFT